MTCAGSTKSLVMNISVLLLPNPYLPELANPNLYEVSR